MPKESQTQKISLSIIEEIENRIEELINKKKEKVKKEFEEKIRAEKDEAQRRMDNVEKEFKEKKERIIKYRTVIAEFEKSEKNLKNQIEEHLNRAIQYQAEIEKMTGRTLEELKKVNELSQKLGELSQEAEEETSLIKEETSLIKKDLEKKFGIVTDVSERDEIDETGLDLEQELTKLKKIKELINKLDVKPDEEGELEKELEGLEEVKEEIVSSLSKKEQGIKKEPLPEGKESTGTQESKDMDRDDLEILEKYRKTEPIDDRNEVSYYQKNDKIILDGECIISALGYHLGEVKKLYIKLAQTESFKDQFQVNQEITGHQETLRRIFLECVRMLKRESCSFPKYTSDILNIDVLKEILGKLILEKWTDQDNFTAFTSYAAKIIKNYYGRRSSPNGYLKSVMRGLGI